MLLSGRIISCARLFLYSYSECSSSVPLGQSPPKRLQQGLEGLRGIVSTSNQMHLRPLQKPQDSRCVLLSVQFPLRKYSKIAGLQPPAELALNIKYNSNVAIRLY